MGALSRLGWAATRTLGIGPLLIGVRSNTERADLAVGAAFASHLADGPESEPNYSVRLETSTEDESGSRRFHTLYKADCFVIRTNHRSRVLRALRTSLARYAGGGSGLLQLRRVALLSDAGVILMPPELLPRLEEIEEEMGQVGLRVVDPPFVHLDPETGEAVVPEPAVAIDEEAVQALDGDEGGVGDASDLIGARFRVRHWALQGPDEEAEARRMDAFAAMLAVLEEEANLPMQPAMTAVSRAISSASVSWIRHQKGRDLLQAILSATSET